MTAGLPGGGSPSAFPNGFPGGWPQLDPTGPGNEAIRRPDEASEFVRAQLFERRVVLLSGELDDSTAGAVVAQLMTLDAIGDDHVTLQVNSWGGSLQAAFSVIDTIDLLGVPVHSVCVGRAEGPVVGVVAVAERRRAAPHARFRLCQPRFDSRGTASELAEWSLQCQRQVDRFCDRLAQATHQPAGKIADDLEASRFLSAQEALRYGLIDDIGRTDRSGQSPPPRPFGFRPPE
jgi:ATP-dependent Clp protease protease subunit